MTLRKNLLLSTLLCLCSAGTTAMTTLTYEWVDLHCGIVATDGSVSARPCATDQPSFTALVQPGEAALLFATLAYAYHDDGLLLDRREGFQMDAFGFQMRYFDHEAAGLHISSSTCQNRYCNPFPEWTDSFSGPIGVLLGDNDVADDLTGRIDFTVTAGVRSAWPGAETRTAFLGATAETFSPVAAIPEPSTWALMAAGLLSIAVLARRRGRFMRAAQSLV
jgi:PEP-CTERM motif